MKIKLAVIGSRGFDDYFLLQHSILENFTVSEIEEIISGGAKGADTLAEHFADKFGIKKRIFHPDWKKFGKLAGFIRNKDIINNSTHVIAFWDGVSRGTKDSLQLAKSLNLPCKIIYFVCDDT